MSQATFKFHTNCLRFDERVPYLCEMKGMNRRPLRRVCAMNEYKFVPRKTVSAGGGGGGGRHEQNPE